jgi:hypothetical protein
MVIVRELPESVPTLADAPIKIFASSAAWIAVLTIRILHVGLQTEVVLGSTASTRTLYVPVLIQVCVDWTAVPDGT